MADRRSGSAARDTGQSGTAADAHLAEIEQQVRRLVRELATARAELTEAAAGYTTRTERLLLSLVEVLDAFERVLADVSAREAALSGAEKGWLRNVGTVHHLLANAIRDQGVTPIDPPREFDPVWHHVTETVSDRSRPAGAVVREEIRGYMWDTRVLRKSGVVVVGRERRPESADAGASGGGTPWASS